MEIGYQCLCDTHIRAGAQVAKASECDTPCTANVSETCGGYNRATVFSFTCSGPPDPTPKPLPPPPPPPPSDRNLCPDYSREYCKPSIPLEDRIQMVRGYCSGMSRVRIVYSQRRSRSVRACSRTEVLYVGPCVHDTQRQNDDNVRVERGGQVF